MQQITFAPQFAAWQRAARRALGEGVLPEEIHWQELVAEQPALALFQEDEGGSEAAPAGPVFRVPREFLPLAKKVACHSEERRWALLYRVLWRLTHGEPKLLEILSDPDVRTLYEMERAVRRDVHKMRAYVRFREVQAEDGQPWFIAWFEPSHHVVEANADFFVDRFATMRWSILTPERCLHWDGQTLARTAGVKKSDAPSEDAMEELWRRYYASIFNPARVKVHTMEGQMPKKYWKNLPEASIIPVLLQEAPRRVNQMLAQSEMKRTDDEEAREWHPARPPAVETVEELAAAARGCQACPLYKQATQTVFGEGPNRARIVMLGEQPGDQEDRGGRPFIGPAGLLMNRAMGEAGLPREECYVTNTVKHFKWEPRGKRRLHQTPNARDVAACRPWFEAELALIKPGILLCLGGTAAKAIFGPSIKVLSARGQWRESPFCARTFITVHPSSLLRAPTEEAREAAYRQFVADLRMVAEELAGLG